MSLFRRSSGARRFAIRRPRELDECRDPELGRLSVDGQRALHEGDPAVAERNFARLVELFTERAGPRFDRTLVWKAFLAKAVAAQGRLDEAVTLQRSVIADRTVELGPDHLYTLTIRGQLGQTLARHGRPAEATALLESLLADERRVLGGDHPSTLNTVGNLAEAYALAGDDERACTLYEAQLAGRTRVLGRRHRDTLLARSNLAALRARVAEPTVAVLDDLADNLAEVITHHGEDSDEAFAARGYLAEHHLRLGDGHAALAVLVPLERDRSAELGPTHPATLRSRRMITEAIDLIDKPFDALAQLDDLIRDLVLAVGPNHIDTFHARTLRLDILADFGDVVPDDVYRLRKELLEVTDSDHPLVDRLNGLFHRVLRDLFWGDEM
jgi:hypothetical protein